MKIPIRNLYYLFTYAWARFPAGEAVTVGEDECPDLLNLFAKLLIDGLHRLIRRGLDRGYVGVVDVTRSPRGRLLIDDIIKRQTLLRGEAACTYDELVHDVLHNQILKATARILANSDQLLPAYRHELRLLSRKLEDVTDIRLTGGCFRRVQLSRNSRQYGVLLQLCEFVFQSLLPDQQGAGSRFANILEDEVRMSAVFEDFLRNFYFYEQRHFDVTRETLSWEARALTLGAIGYLPVMQTDITLRSPDRTIVMDAKYYAKTLAQFHGGEKVHASNLYQLFAYLRHTARKYRDVQIDGALIYPTVNKQLRLDYQLADHRIRVATVDLAREWADIHQELLGLLFASYGDLSEALTA